jgi:hypothetical protein
MKSVLEKQKSAQIIEFPKSNILHNAGETIAQESIKIQKSSNETNERVIKSDDKLIKSNDKLSDNVKKLAETIKKQQEAFKEKVKSVTETSQGRRQYKTIGDRVGAVKDNVKDFFTTRGFLDKTGIAKRNSGGIMSEYLDRREDRQKYVKSRSEIDQNNVVHAKQNKVIANKDGKYTPEEIAVAKKERTSIQKKVYGKQFNDQQTVQRSITKNESVIKGYKDQGFKDSQIERSEAGKSRAPLASALMEVDTRLRPDAVKASLAEKVQPEGKKKSLAEKVKPEGKKSNIIQFPLQAMAKATGKDKPAKSEDDKIEKSTSQKLLDSANSSEADIEMNKKVDEQTDLLEIIAENTGGAKKDKPKAEKSDMGLGLLGTLLAGAIGTLIGVITAQVNAIKLFAKALLPEAIIAKITKSFAAVQEFFSGVFGKIKTLFSFGEESKIGKVFSMIKSGLSSFIAPFTEAFQVIKGLVSGPLAVVGKVFTGIREYFAIFAKTVGKVAGIVGKLMLPVTIILTIWDTVKGMLAGFEEGGIVGAISGAIKGFFNSLIFGPLDMIKDAIAWVLGIFGFDNAKKLLESFSLESMFSGLVDALFYIPKQIQKLLTSPIESLKNLGSFISDAFGSIGNLMGTLVDAFLYIPTKMLGLIQEFIFDPLSDIFKPVTDFFKTIKDNILGFFENFSIPEIGFTIPIINKKVSIGPFTPFKSSAAAPGAAGGAAAPAGNSDAGAGAGSSEFAKTDPRRLDTGKPTSELDAKFDKGMAKARGKIDAVPEGDSVRVQGKLVKAEDNSTGKPTSELDAKFDKGMAKARGKIDAVPEGDSVRVQGKLVGADGAKLTPATEPEKSKAKVEPGEMKKGTFDKMSSKPTIENADGTKRLMTPQEVASAKEGMLNKTAMAAPTEASAVYNKSAANAGAAIVPAAAPSNTLIAPTTNVSNNTTNMVRLPARNQDVSLQSYINSRYGT